MTTLSIQNMSLGYGDKTILSGLNLTGIEPGSLIGVLGPNGVGKSTFLRALAGVGNYDGTVLLNNENIEDMPHVTRSGLIGYLPQTLPQGTTLLAYEAVLSACRAVRPDLNKQAVDALIEDIFDLLEIRHLAFHTMNKLSGGQRQMVGLAQIIVRKPALLLLDEPTSALDLRWQLGVFDVVKSLLQQRGGICLMPIHDINLALRHCDRIALFAEGGLLAFGTPKEAMSAENLRRAYRVDGRVEYCSKGNPFVIAETPLPFETLKQSA
jgi:iron complex transport system ATP-binding protein